MTAHDLPTRHAQQFTVSSTGLARHYAVSGDMWAAVHAQTLSYIAAADWLLRVHDIADREHRLHTIAAELSATKTAGDDSVVDVLSAVLKHIVDQLPVDMLADFMSIITHPRDLLDDTTPGAPVSKELHRHTMESWTPGNDVLASINRARTSQVDALVQAQTLFADGKTEDATLLVHTSDVSALQAWLMEQCLAVGDEDLMHARIRWDMFVESLSHVQYLPADARESVDVVRSRMAWPLGPQNAQAFSAAIPEL